MGINKIIKKGCIAWVNFGLNKGSVQSGNRLAIVIQNDVGNKYSSTTIVAPLTSSEKKQLPTHYKLKEAEYEFLSYDSIILAEQVKTVEKCDLEVVGEINDKDMIELDKILAISMGLSIIAS